VRILIVEDNADTAHLLKLILKAYGEVDTAGDGLQGVEAFLRAWEEENPYDLICLDIMMPRMSGLEALRKIREEEEQMGVGGSLGTKVVMLTAREDEETIHEAITIGCEGYVFKTRGKGYFLDKLRELGIIKNEGE
jgi:two-component system chemotaxis response regulator CheY